MPLRSFAPSASGDAGNASNACAASRWLVNVQIAAVNVVVDWTAAACCLGSACTVFRSRFTRPRAFSQSRKRCRSYGQIKAQRGTAHVQSTMYPFAEMCNLMGFPAVWQFVREHAE
jgi:hypothetical protein